MLNAKESNMNQSRHTPASPPPASCILHSRSAFTLVELLVVITIIGILVSLIGYAAARALTTAHQNQIKTELNQISMAVDVYKNTYGSYPPNVQIDDIAKDAADPQNYDRNSSSDATIDERQVLDNLKRHLRQAFSRHQEPPELLRRLAGDTALAGALPGGMSAGEAIVFWLGGFSTDDRYPISGEGGPSYRIDNLPGSVPPKDADPLQRNWIFPFTVARLQPRDADNFFDPADGRFIEYNVTVNGVAQTRRINFWQYVPAKSEQPYLYFDVSRHPAMVVIGTSVNGPFDPPAATDLSSTPLHVHPIKVRSESVAASSPIQFANPDKFQILHCGVDDEWGEEAFEQMSVHAVGSADPSAYLLFPDGPFTGDAADTLTNFAEGTLEANQP